jgi:hypothetical protein
LTITVARSDARAVREVVIHFDREPPAGDQRRR